MASKKRRVCGDVCWFYVRAQNGFGMVISLNKVSQPYPLQRAQPNVTSENTTKLREIHVVNVSR